MRTEVLRVGYFGSYARGDWGVGSDLDLVILTAHSRDPWERRSAAWDTTGLPVPTEVFVYTLDEWDRMTAEPGFLQKVAREAVWVFTRDPAAADRGLGGARCGHNQQQRRTMNDVGEREVRAGERMAG